MFVSAVKLAVLSAESGYVCVSNEAGCVLNMGSGYSCIINEAGCIPECVVMALLCQQENWLCYHM